MRALASAFILFATLRASAEAPLAWDAPAEVATDRSDRYLIPVAVARAASGALGVFVFEKEAGLVLHVAKDGREFSRKVILTAGLPGDPRVDGGVAEVVITNLEEQEAFFSRIDLDAGKELPRVKIASKLPSSPMFSRLLADGEHRYVLIGCERGEAMFSGSDDAGKTWGVPVQVAKGCYHDDAIAPAFFRTSRGLHVLVPDADGKLGQWVSADAGTKWVAAEEPTARTRPGPAHLVAGSGDGDTIIVVVLTQAGEYVPMSSTDAGKHWDVAPPIASGRKGDVAALFQVKQRGAVAVVAFSELGEGPKQTGGARVIVTKDSGLTWTEVEIDEGVIGATGFPAVDLAADGRLTIAFTARGPAKSKDDGFVLVRQTLPKDGTPAPAPDGKSWWKSAPK